MSVEVKHCVVQKKSVNSNAEGMMVMIHLHYLKELAYLHQAERCGVLYCRAVCCELI
jgi:hypothetical protein